jgi:hypothetical protein
MMPLRSMYNSWLKENVMKIVFTKNDGTERTMLCSLKAEHIPENDKETLEEKITTTSKDIDFVRCIDVDSGEWRSFKPSSVKSYSFP